MKPHAAFFALLAEGFIHFMLSVDGSELKIIDINMQTGDVIVYDSLGVVLGVFNYERDGDADNNMEALLDDGWRDPGFGQLSITALHMVLDSLGVPS